MSGSLLGWRRAVHELYRQVRLTQDPAAGHALWVTGRDRLFREHPDSPLDPDDPLRETGLPVAPYDPQWRVRCPLVATEADSFVARTATDGDVPFARIGRLETPWGSLDAWWLGSYGGGLFVPVKDAGAGRLSYGGGRYLLDTTKGADLGGEPDGSDGGLVVDFNFAYHPSCRYDPQWACPLAPPGNVLTVTVPVGELLG